MPIKKTEKAKEEKKKGTKNKSKSSKSENEKKLSLKKSSEKKSDTKSSKKEKTTLETLEKKSETSEKKTTPKVSALKADELFGGGFLSELGFKKEEKQPELEIEEKIQVTKSDIFEKSSENIIPQTSKKEKIPFGKPTFRFDVEQPKKIIPPTHKYQQTSSSSNFQNIQKQKIEKSGYTNKFSTISSKPNFQHIKTPETPQSQSTQIIQTKKPEKIGTTSANLVKKTEIIIDDQITIKEFAEKMGVPLPEVMKTLLQNKIMKGITASLDFDTAALIAAEFGITVKRKENKVDIQTFMSGDLQAILDLDKEAETLLPRAPIVTVMGHVDHGKTSLLDYLRKTEIAAHEAGGITQSIGASMITHNGKPITFIDTPGHELFTNLRARGAKLTNIAVIVVAADDSVMPQTIESIGHAKAAGVPIIIAITKIDKPGNKIEQIKTDIAKHGLTPEDRGGDVPVIGISSKTGQGIPELLEQILLQAELLELKYNPNRSAIGVVLDAHKDPKQGVVTTVIVMTGTLKIGDIVVAYNTYGKVRRMHDRKGQNITQASGGEPVQILGITHLPEPGRIVEVVKNEKEAQEKIALIQEHIKKQSPESAIQQFIAGLSNNKESELRLILKADGFSSLEALKQAINTIQLPKNVTIKIVHADVGHFSESDLSLAQASGALLIGFNISINAILKKKAESMKIEMRNYDIIYELTDYIQNLVNGMIKIETKEVLIGKLEVLGIFFSKAKEMIIGGKIISGKVKNKIKFRVLRGEDILCNGEIISLHRNKDEVKEVGEGEECGLKVYTGKKIEMGDILEFYEMQEVKGS